jgi:hypothetical protein
MTANCFSVRLPNAQVAGAPKPATVPGLRSSARGRLREHVRAVVAAGDDLNLRAALLSAPHSET